MTAESTSVTEARFMPCPNISTAARQIARLVDRCKAVPSFKADPVRCAMLRIVALEFADAVATSAANGDAPNFDMPDTTDLVPGRNRRPNDRMTMVCSCADRLSGGRNDWL
jgi:hypothetical protein